MPITMLGAGETGLITRVAGNDEVKRHLAELGFVPGSEVTMVAMANGNVIVNVKETRVAIGKAMANKIYLS